MQQHAGSVAEWSIAPVLKTGNGQPFVSSNLTASAKGLRLLGDSLIEHDSDPLLNMQAFPVSSIYFLALRHKQWNGRPYLKTPASECPKVRVSTLTVSQEGVHHEDYDNRH